MKRFPTIWLQYAGAVGGLALFAVVLIRVADWALASFNTWFAFVIYVLAVATIWAALAAVMERR